MEAVRGEEDEEKSGFYSRAFSCHLGLLGAEACGVPRHTRVDVHIDSNRVLPHDPLYCWFL